MNLELVTTDDLLDELERRHDATIFGAISSVGAPGDERGLNITEVFRHSGHPRICQGLCVGLQEDIQSMIKHHRVSAKWLGDGQ